MSTTALCPCCTGHEARKLLEDAVHALPARGARELAAVVRGLDAVYLDHAPFDPVAFGGTRWWEGLRWRSR
ncbi:hypothetical protein [Amycolatopsis antarctica]|uniref:hypothetical protein n=1 Tax=Amycolatopsis antarctica TaxID=1854586 RepID=UPI001055A263|nr:hypothetical protein [Amycolatopsis antarctica]